jgi:hypothetical protein
VVARQFRANALGDTEEAALAPADRLARVAAARPLFSEVLANWLSRMAALGLGARPAFR